MNYKRLMLDRKIITGFYRSKGPININDSIASSIQYSAHRILHCCWDAACWKHHIELDIRIIKHE